MTNYDNINEQVIDKLTQKINALTFMHWARSQNIVMLNMSEIINQIYPTE